MTRLVVLLSLLISCNSMGQSIKGAWKSQESTGSTSTMIIADNYLMVCSYSVLNKYFERAEGGPFVLNGKTMTYTPEFDNGDTAKIGIPIVYKISQEAGVLTMEAEEPRIWMLVDEAGKAPMAGTWAITERANEQGELVKIHQTGTRKTLKILSGTRFQWAAIDPAVKGFYATGGGTYTAKNGKYTENIEFFSKQNSRVGASLTFDWKLEKGRWHHSGKSTAGAPISEVWEKIK
jgi:hypothetical protein